MKAACRKIAVLGGGIGSLSAVFEMTSTPGWQEQFDITVYQLGWRLGGKGASGRNLSKQCRNEEHGLHVWMGFYDNAFDLIRRCYEELDPIHGHRWRSWRDAFSPLDGFVLTEPSTGPLFYGLPRRSDEPGKRPPRKFVFWHYAVQLAQLIADVFGRSGLADYLDVATDSRVRSDRSRQGKIRIDVTPNDLARMFARMPADPNQHTDAQHEGLVQATQNLLEGLSLVDRERFHDPSVLKYWKLVDLGLAILRGIVADRVIFEGFGVIEEREWSDWMMDNYAHPEALDSAAARASYDLVFGYAGGDPARPSVAAGTGTYCLLRLLLDYREAVAYELNAGMGEAVFTPLYLVLRDRGVKFKFFHRVRKLIPTSDGSAVGKIEIEIQAEPREDEEYRPLVTVNDLLCWPSAPLLEQLSDAYEGDPTEYESTSSQRRGRPSELKRGTEFDDVILGIPLPALGEIAQELASIRTTWREMQRNVRSTATIAAQLWITATTQTMGWPRKSTLLGGFEKPFDTVWDADKTIALESFSKGREPKGVMYLCGVLKEDFVRRGINALELTEQWLRGYGAILWPGAGTGGTFDWAILYDPSNSTGAQRLAWQHVAANVDLSQYYVQSWPGTAKYRMWADQSGFSNLYLAGDWVRTSLNAGCMEAATMAGLRAARSITGRPIEISGEDDLFPRPKGQPNLPGARLAGVVGSVEAVAVILPVSTAAVSAMIPKGLRLLPAPGTLSDHHPVGFLFCRHWDVRPALAPSTGGLEYSEFAVAVPFVSPVSNEAQHAHTVLPLLLLDSLLATVGGRALFGFEKKLARLSIRGELRSARRVLSNSPLVTIETHSAGPAGKADSFPKLQLARQIFEQPVLVHHLGHWRQMKMNFRLESTVVTPMTGILTVHRPFLAGLEPGDHVLQTIQLSSFGAFAFSSNWELSNLL